MAVFDTPIISNDQSIERVLATGLPVLLIFLGQPSPELSQVMDQVARNNAGNLLVVRIPAKENPVTTHRFQVHSTPAWVGYLNGQVVSQGQGTSGSELQKHVDFLLGKGPRPEPAAAQPAAQPGKPQPTSEARTSGSGGTPVMVEDATYEQEVLRSPIPVVVDFWAPWCGPCRMVEPTVKKLAHEWAGRVKMVKINVDENPVVASRLGVQGIPTMVVVKNGQIVDRWAGALPEPAMRSRLANSIP